MKKNNFWTISLCVLLILAVNIGLNAPLRIAIAANAIIIIFDIAKDVWRFNDERRKEKN